ncbi:TPA: helix-turn-helix transcriptional regulator [Candidatus Spyradomonas excrementavium]|nr:helix-turn-helix transcriptional regulator [Candidatus Spyradomonas excrementavium]
MDKVLLKKLAKKIKELRKINGFSQDDLAVYSGIARSTIGNLETAQNDIVLSKLNKIAKALKVSLSELLDF